MTYKLVLKTFICLVVLSLMFMVSAKASNSEALISDLAKTADLIAVATIAADFQNATTVWLTLIIDRVLKGSAQPGSVVVARYDFPKLYRGPKRVNRRRGLWFLKANRQGELYLLPSSEGYPGFESIYYPVSAVTTPKIFPYAGGAPVIDKVISELAESVQSSDGRDGLAYRLEFTLRFEDSALVGAMYRQFSQSSSSNLRIIGLAGLIRHGDVAALIRGEQEITSAAKSPLIGMLVLGIDGFRKSDPEAIHSLGRLADELQGVSLEVRRAAAYALRNIHTKDTLPYLSRLLDSPDRTLRGHALYGFNAFATDMPIITPSVNVSESIDAALNPGRQRSNVNSQARQLLGAAAIEDTQPFIHFGPFHDPAEEARHVDFWKSWWQRHSPGH